MPIDRREFLAGAAAVVGAATGGVARASSGKSDIRVAVVGVHARGNEHLRGLADNVVAICDVDSRVLAERSREHAERTGIDPARYTDYRRMLDEANIDAVSIATPNHTHALIAIAAMQAGKDVYVEKPVSHNVWEGRQLAAAAHKYGRICQCGTQSRSSPSLQDAVAWVRGGALGKIEYAIGTCYKPRKPIGSLGQPLAIPSHIDYDLWCGPAEKRDLYRPHLHYDWHWDWTTGNGDMGNQGIHQMDIARWFLGEDGLAPHTLSIGGRLGYSDAADTPNTQVVYHDYAAAPLVFETRGLPRSKAAQRDWGRSMDRYRGSQIGVVVQCEGGHVVIPSYTEAIAFDRQGEKVKHWRGGGDHYRNWLDAIAADDAGLLNGPVREGHVSSALCHVGGVSHQLGEPTVAREIGERVSAMPLLSSAVERMASHLRANDVDIDSADEALTLGTWLEIDTETERVMNNAAAEPLWTRSYREPFAVPDLNA